MLNHYLYAILLHYFLKYYSIMLNIKRYVRIDNFVRAKDLVSLNGGLLIEWPEKSFKDNDIST